MVEDFVRNLPGSYGKYANIRDLGFTEADYARCKRDILKFKSNVENPGKPRKEKDFYLYQNNIDFDRHRPGKGVAYICAKAL